MFLVAGLGNPGEQYASTPHNMGFLVVDRLAARYAIRVTRPEGQALVGPGSIGGKPVLLAKPQTYMNLSGISVKALTDKYEIPPSDLILIYDDLDFPWGILRVKPKGSAPPPPERNWPRSSREWGAAPAALNPGNALPSARHRWQ